ncbi:MAG: GNAT family N-acetyltransferase [Burkholderiaceae bacterium]|nr:GNAT family N-acetyltransferase [Burkholderiaceae bacterium]
MSGTDPVDDLTRLRQALPQAELAYAAFNARRTRAEAPAAAPVCNAQADGWAWLLDGSRPASAYYNRAWWLASGPLPAAALSSLPAAVAALELLPAQQDGEAAQALLQAGFRPVAALHYLGACPRQPLAAQATPVRRLTADDVELFFDLLAATGTPFPPERRQRTRQHYATPQFQLFVAGDDGQGRPAAWATLHVHAGPPGCGFLGNAYTLPGQRGRGLHTALLAARWNAAVEQGLQRLYCDVEPDSDSQRHNERLGLRLLTGTTLWQR